MNLQVETRLGIVRKVLVVDDELINRRILGNILEKEYEVLYAENGKQALDLVRNNEGLISLILLDLLMPEMDGYELLDVLRNDAGLKQIPVIVLTSERDAEVRILQLGAVDFIPKPYDRPEVIMARVKRSIELYEDRNLIDATQTDTLTGLFNRDFFLEYIDFHDQYYPDTETDAIVLNINRFHLVNEMYGRDFGNEVLIKIAGSIRELVSKDAGIACRAGSDEFYIYLPHRENHEEILNHIGKSISNMIDINRLRIGVYQEASRHLEPDRRFDCALLACNSIRNNYMTQIAYYDSQMHDAETYSEHLINDIDTALSEKQFQVYFQPKFNIKGDKPVLSSAEALIRWKHPELGMVRPDMFIPLFEGNGLVQKLDRFVWREVAAKIREWRDRYGITIPVSVNVSRIDMLEPGFIDEIKSIVDENGLKPEDYYLEITESAYTDSSDQMIHLVSTLRALGFKIEMDDFGSGYSSLNMLSNLPIDVLKMDMKFIKNIHTNPKDLRMVELVMDIAKFMHLTVVAEGVELKEQYDLLKITGCDIIQGFYFSKPVPAEEFEKIIEERTGEN